MLRNVHKELKSLKNIYFKDEIAIKTVEGRSVHLLTVSSNEDKMDSREDKLSDEMFNHGDRCYQFKASKRVVFVSARVHPG